MVDWTRVQGTFTQTGSGTSNSLTLGGTVGTGNVIFGGVLLTVGSFVHPLTGITDDKGNAYRVVLQGDDGNTLNTVAFRSLHPLTNSPQVITVTCSPATTTFWIVADEFTTPTGTTDISLDGFGRGFGINTASTGNFGTWRNDAIIYCLNFDTSASTTGAGFTAGQGTGTQICTQWKIIATPTTGLNGTYATQTGTAFMVAFAVAPQSSLWEPIQHVLQRTVTTNTTGSASFNFAVSSGSVVFGCIAVDNLANLTSLQDDKGNSYTVLSPNANGRAIIWSGGRITNGPTTITAILSSSSSIVFLMAAEVIPPLGTVSLDGTPVNTFIATTSTASTTSANVTTTHSNDFAWSMNDSSTSPSLNTSGYSQLDGIFPQTQTWSDAYALLVTPGTYNTTWSYGSSGGNENLSLAAFSASQPSGAQPFGILGIGSSEW